MPNTITASGITTATRDELIAQFTADLQAIYGLDINLGQDTPDGQWLNIMVQAILDLQDLVVQVYNGFDPDLAIGAVLDQRVAINGIQRQAGTYTITNVTIDTSQALNLYGIDQTNQEVFTVADNAGSQWVLISTVNIPGPGSYPLAFRSAVPGEVLTVPNTITIPTTIVLGVTSINNPTTYTTLGINEESDAELKIRRQKSVSIASQGYLAGLLAALENISDVASAFVYENTTGLTDGLGVPGHSIWVIIDGSPNPAEVANAIYKKRNAGAGMKGDQTYIITQVDTSQFVIRWDIVTPQTLFIKFDATSLDGVNPPDIVAIRAGLVTQFVPGVAEQVNINDLATTVQNIDNNCLVTNAGFGSAVAGPYTPTLTPTAKNFKFAITEPNIVILPMIMNDPSPTVVNLQTFQFEALGGFGAYTWTMDAAPSGGSVGVSGLYTAGATPATDIVRATDTLGNFVTATITVT